MAFETWMLIVIACGKVTISQGDKLLQVTIMILSDIHY